MKEASDAVRRRRNTENKTKMKKGFTDRKMFTLIARSWKLLRATNSRNHAPGEWQLIQIQQAKFILLRRFKSCLSLTLMIDAIFKELFLRDEKWHLRLVDAELVPASVLRTETWVSSETTENWENSKDPERLREGLGRCRAWRI